MRSTFIDAAQHLLPGALITLVFVGIAALAVPRGWPASLALLTTAYILRGVDEQRARYAAQ